MTNFEFIEDAISAIQENNINICREIFKCNSDSICDDIIDRVCALERVEIFKILYSIGHSFTSYIGSAISFDNVKVVQFLHNNGVNLIPRLRIYLEIASMNNCIDSIKYLVIHGGISNISRNVIERLIFDGLVYRSYELVDFLLNCVPDGMTNIDIEDSYKNFYSRYRTLVEKTRDRAAKKIYFWWIPICYNIYHPSGCGKRMRDNNYKTYQRICCGNNISNVCPQS